MVFHNETARVFVPDGLADEAALERTTHMAIGAHQDDLEIMAFDGISRCFQQEHEWFCGVVVTDGSGSPRDGSYVNCTDEEMQLVQRQEQKKAAVIGEYGAQILLDYPSSAVKDASDSHPLEDIKRIVTVARPAVVYTHNLADKHDTHVAVALRVIQALRSVSASARPCCIYGCEVWRDLDWLLDRDKVAFDLSVREHLQAALMGVFDSQIAGGKRYDLATLGRRRAHATYYASHATDVATKMSFAMDLTPLVESPDLEITDFVQAFIQRFSRDVTDRIRRIQ